MLPPRTRRCRQPTGLDLPPGTSYLGMTPHHTPSMIMKVRVVMTDVFRIMGGDEPVSAVWIWSWVGT